jgi:threonine synthase
MRTGMKTDLNKEVKTPLDSPYSLIDGAAGEIDKLTESMEEQYRISKDKNFPIEERLEAFENIIDSEVGDTTLWRARNIEREVGLRQIYLKFEGGNPTGTQKDRIAFLQVLDALRRGFDTIAIATCGNYGVAMALAASLAGIKCLIYIPEYYHTKRISEMMELGAEIIRTPGDYENAVEFSRTQAMELEYYDANPGGANISLQLTAYGQIAYEIYDELRDAPFAVAMPVSNGTTMAGVFKGFISLYRRGKISRIPRMVAGSSYKKNPIIRAFHNKSITCVDLKPETIRETTINEPLINWHSIDGDLALDAIRRSNGWAAGVSDKNLANYSRMVREKEGMNILPASTAGLIALIEQHRKEALPNDRYVVIFTGRRS